MNTCDMGTTLKKTPRLSPALFQDNCDIQHKHIHDLLKYACLGKGHNVSQPSWCHLHHQKRLRGVVVIVLQDLSQLHFYRFYLHFRCLRRLFRHRFSLPPPPCDFIGSLVGIVQNCVTEGKESYSVNHFSSTSGSTVPGGPADTLNGVLDPIIQKYGTERHGLTRYLLSEEEMRKNGYPLVGCPKFTHFVHTGCTGEVTDNSPLFGLDCEMCLTDKGKELTRVSLVDANGHCIMDELVKPDNPIRNYLTRYSGITKQLLLPVTTKLKDVQDKLKKLLPPAAVLVGHSLENDLRALQMIHPSVIDTSLLFTRRFDMRYKLKFLAEAVLGREIQQEDITGHNPEEDAKAALDLAHYFIHHGPEKVAQLDLFNIFVNQNDSFPIQEEVLSVKQNGLLHSPNIASPGRELGRTSSLAEFLTSCGRNITYVAKVNGLKGAKPPKPFESTLCSSNEEVLEEACSLIPSAPISFVQFSSGSSYSRCSENMNATVRDRFAEMMTVFAGPFRKDVCLKSVKRSFRTCGPIRSMSIVSESYQPYVCVEFNVLEGAQLAVEALNGTYVDGCCVKVQRLVTQRTLDCENLLKEMEEDLENKDVIYVSGFKKSLTEEFLQHKFSHLKDIKAIYVPTNPQNQKYSKYCYLKFHCSQSALIAAECIRAQGELRSRKAITASHLHQWLQPSMTSVCPEQQRNPDILPKKDDLTDKIENLDRKIWQLYESLQSNTLCLILFPGNNSADGLLSGFGLMGIKDLSG
ncbi:RNA exonuclease 5 [Rhinophrynus dorsalis]